MQCFESRSCGNLTLKNLERGEARRWRCNVCRSGIRLVSGELLTEIGVVLKIWLQGALFCYGDCQGSARYAGSD
jgi:hypothetical protein